MTVSKISSLSISSISKIYGIELSKISSIYGQVISIASTWLDGWDYRKSITLSRASGAVTNYQMKVLVGESSGATGEDVDCGGKCKTDFSDLRFTTSDKTTLLDYWIESVSGTTPNQLATIWVEFDNIGTDATTFYMYYGKADASAVSNGANTFILFDDFERGADGDAAGGSWTTDHCFISTASDIGDVAGFFGSRSARLGGAASPLAYIAHAASDGAYAIDFYCKKQDGVVDFRCGHGNGTKRLIAGIDVNENVIYYDGSWRDTSIDVSVDTWVKLGIRNISFASGTFDIYIGDSLVKTGATMHTATSLSNAIYIYHGAGLTTVSSWFDNFVVRNWRDTEPAWGSWGTEENKWLDGWLYRKPITLSRASGAVTDYQMKVLVSKSASATGEDVDCNGNCLDNFDDLRFTTDNGVTLLDYWIESISSDVATIWVEFDNIGTGDTTFYMYYGNNGAVSVSNITNTFIIGDDFERGNNGDTIGGDWTETVAHAHISTTHDIGDSTGFTGTRGAMLIGGAGRATATTPLTASDTSYAIQCRVYHNITKDVHSVIQHGNSSNRLLVGIFASDNSIQYYDGSWKATGSTATLNAWSLLEVRNINFTAATFDIYLNGSLVKSAATMHASDVLNNILKMYGTSVVGKDVWVDNYIVRNWRDTEPAWGTWGAEEEVSSGGIKILSGNYVIHKFLSDDNFIIRKDINAEILVVAGGGAGGTWCGGGGGAGGVLYTASHTLSAGTYSVTVGDGAPHPSSNAPGGDGENSVFDTLTATGGGGGGNYPTKPGRNGGCGGGGAYTTDSLGGTGVAGPPRQGYDGGAGGSGKLGGGGGGAGEAGNADGGGYGGDGPSTYSDLLIAADAGVDIGGVHYIAGGGGGWVDAGNASIKPGGDGGGGAGGSAKDRGGNLEGVDGTPNTGGGGGGGHYHNHALHGGGGGSGIVIVRYLK